MLNGVNLLFLELGIVVVRIGLLLHKVMVVMVSLGAWFSRLPCSSSRAEVVLILFLEEDKSYRLGSSLLPSLRLSSRLLGHVPEETLTTTTPRRRKVTLTTM